MSDHNREMLLPESRAELDRIGVEDEEKSKKKLWAGIIPSGLPLE